MKVLIADDQIDVRSALKILFEHVDGLYDIDEAEDTASMLHKAECNRPDLILMDWELSNRSMAETVPELRRRAAGVRILALSGRPEAAEAAGRAGVDGFASKGESPKKLLEAIYKLMDC